MRLFVALLLLIGTVHLDALSFPWSRRSAQAPCAGAGVQIELVKGWKTVSCDVPSVVLCAKARGRYRFPPSLNLVVQENKTQLAFDEQRKSIESCEHPAMFNTRCSQMGDLQTALGPAKLSLTETVTPLGPMKALQAVCADGDKVYVLTAAAHSEDFYQLYDSFLTMMGSLHSVE